MENIFEFNVYKYATLISDTELLEMANVSPKKTGIGGVYIWFGPNPHYHGKRVKVSNTPDKFSKDDCFTITIPKFEIIGKVNKSLITQKVYEDIINFLELNLKLIEDFSDEKISTDEFIDNIVSIK